MTHRPRALRIALALVVAWWPALLPAQDAIAPAWSRITYISGTTIYLEVGSKDGLTERSTLDVVRGGAVVARLRVTALSSSRAACEVLPPPAELAVGDSVRFVAEKTAPAAAVGAASATSRAVSTAEARRRRGSPLRGRVGLRYLVVAPDAGAPGGLTQPAYDLRLDGERLGGTGFGISADVRAQRTQYATAGASASPSANSTRVYQAALAWYAGTSGLRFAAGRQLAGALSSVGLFDGLSGDYDRLHWGTGVFAGTQPDVASFGLSGRVREYGLYGQWHTRAAASQSAALTLGGVGSYVGSAIDREYAFARFTSNGPRLSVYATQELDFNRGWKRSVEQAATTPTATFASIQFTPTHAVALFGGFDNRRSVRLYRDYLDPEIAFDDAFREGTWGGITFAAPRYARLSIDRRDSRGGAGGTAGSTTVTGSVSGLTRARLGLRARATTFAGTQSSGTLMSGAVDVDPWGFLRLEANGGARTTTPLGAAATRLTWWGVDADIGIGRSLYLMLSTYREQDAGRGSLQTYASISWRF